MCSPYHTQQQHIWPLTSALFQMIPGTMSPRRSRTAVRSRARWRRWSASWMTSAPATTWSPSTARRYSARSASSRDSGCPWTAGRRSKLSTSAPPSSASPPMLWSMWVLWGLESPPPSSASPPMLWSMWVLCGLESSGWWGKPYLTRVSNHKDKTSVFDKLNCNLHPQIGSKGHPVPVLYQLRWVSLWNRLLFLFNDTTVRIW